MAKKAAQATPNHLLRMARKERGWTQKDVADRIGAPLDLNVTRWERGTSYPSAYYVQKLCELFGKSVSELGLLREQPKTAASPADIQTPIEPTEPTKQHEPEYIWNVPFRRNPFFTGRTHLLHALHEQLGSEPSTTHTHGLTGLGGIGKTQMAVEYAYRYREVYSAILWVRSASRDTLVADFVSFAKLLNLPVQHSQDQMQVVNAVKHWLMQHRDWLLILDNADSLHLLTDFLPTGGQGHILLTTRMQATGTIARSVAIEKLDTSEGMVLLLRRAKLLLPDAPLDDVPRLLRTQAQAIAEVLDGLPLALDQAGAYIEETGCSLSEYLVLFRQYRSALLQRQGMNDDYPYTVASTWALAFQQTEQANPAAAELLRLCAFLAPDAIQETILTQGATELGTVLRPVAGDTFLLNDAIQVLRRYSLMKRNPETKMLNIHRLVQVVVKDGMNAQLQKEWAERTIRAVNATFPAVTFDTWNLCETYMPHVEVCAELVEQHHFQFLQAAQLLERAGWYVLERGRLQQAQPLLQRALAIFEHLYGPEHPDIAAILRKLGLLYDQLDRLEQAEILFERALTISETLLGNEHSLTATILNDLAAMYNHQGKHTQAEASFLRALSIREQVPNTDHLDLADTLNDLAILYVYQGKYAQSEPLYLRALRIREQSLAPDHPYIATTLNNLAWLYNHQGRYEQAESLYLLSLPMMENALDANHQSIALVRNNLAELYLNQGKLEEAESLCRNALSILEDTTGPNHPAVAMSLHTLAEIYRAQHDYEQAEPLYLRSLSIREQIWGSAPPSRRSNATQSCPALRSPKQLRTRPTPLPACYLHLRASIRPRPSRNAQRAGTLQRTPGENAR